MKRTHWRSPWTEFTALCGLAVLAHLGLMLTSRGASMTPGEMATASLSWLLFGFFLSGLALAVVAVIAGVGGGVVFTPIMLAFTPVDSLIVRATGLIVAMFSGLIATGPFMNRGVGNLKLALYCCLGYGTGAFLGSNSAVWAGSRLGPAGDGWMRVALGVMVLLIALSFLVGGKRMEWPQSRGADRSPSRLRLGQAYFEESLGAVCEYTVIRPVWGLLCMILIGLVSGFFGLGAGWAIVPALNLIMAVPLKVAVACSGGLIGMGDCVAVWPYLRKGSMLPLFTAPWLAGVVAGGILGAQVLIRVRSGVTRAVVIGITLFSSLGLLTKGLRTLGYLPALPGAVHGVVLLLIMAGVAVATLSGTNRGTPTGRVSASRPGSRPYEGGLSPADACRGADRLSAKVPTIPAAQRVYGSLTYWVTIAAAALCVVGPFLAVAVPHRNELNPHRVFYHVWEGLDPAQVWQRAGSGFPGGHFWMRALFKGDGLTQLGLVLGCLSASLGLCAAALAFLRQRPRSVGWAALSLGTALMVALAMLGVWSPAP